MARPRPVGAGSTGWHICAWAGLPGHICARTLGLTHPNLWWPDPPVERHARVLGPARSGEHGRSQGEGVPEGGR
jgi:hypothetical protein